MVIDMHTHLGVSEEGAAPQSVSPVLKMLADNNVDQAVVMGIQGLRSNCLNHQVDNDRIHEVCQKAPEHLLPSFTINPLFKQEAIKEIERCRNDLGLHLLKLHPWLQGFSITSVEMNAVAETCQKLGVTVFFHDGTPPYGTPLQLARLCREFPDLKVVSGHAGLNDLWNDSCCAAQRYANYYICLCGVAVSQMQSIVERVPPRQICVGSDAAGTLEDLMWYRWEGWRRVTVSDETRTIIENTTPKRLLGFESAS